MYYNDHVPWSSACNRSIIFSYSILPPIKQQKKYFWSISLLEWISRRFTPSSKFSLCHFDRFSMKIPFLLKVWSEKAVFRVKRNDNTATCVTAQCLRTEYCFYVRRHITVTCTINTHCALPLAVSSMMRMRNRQDRDRNANWIMFCTRAIKSKALHPDLLTSENNWFGTIFLRNIAPISLMILDSV